MTNERHEQETRYDGGDADKGRLFVPSSASLDLAKYRSMADDIEIPEEELDEFLRTLWDIMSGFVQNGFDVKTIPAFLPEIFDGSSVARKEPVNSYDEEDIRHDP